QGLRCLSVGITRESPEMPPVHEHVAHDRSPLSAGRAGDKHSAIVTCHLCAVLLREYPCCRCEQPVVLGQVGIFWSASRILGFWHCRCLWIDARCRRKSIVANGWYKIEGRSALARRGSDIRRCSGRKQVQSLKAAIEHASYDIHR